MTHSCSSSSSSLSTHSKGACNSPAFEICYLSSYCNMHTIIRKLFCHICHSQMSSRTVLLAYNPGQLIWLFSFFIPLLSFTLSDYTASCKTPFPDGFVLFSNSYSFKILHCSFILILHGLWTYLYHHLVQFICILI